MKLRFLARLALVPITRLALVPTLVSGAMVSTCVAIEEEPADTAYGQESDTQAMEQEEEEEVVRESDL